MTRPLPLSLKLALLVSLGVFSSCADPVLTDAVNAQGKETSGISQGEFHRAGQPCVTCHQEGGPASNSPFTVAGTVFAQPLRQIGVEGAEIRMTDSNATKYIAKTNCVGNFFVKAADWDPKFPILVEIAKGNVRRSMQSTIGRNASCAGCHSPTLDIGDPFSQVGHVYLFATDEAASPLGAADCPVDPKRAGTP
jgi:cytochrome c553